MGVNYIYAMKKAPEAQRPRGMVEVPGSNRPETKEIQIGAGTALKWLEWIKPSVPSV